jgi:hypothetical protein
LLIICGAHLPKWKYTAGVFRKISVRALGAQALDIDFVKTSFIGRTHFIFVRYPVTNNSLRYSNRFRFQGNVVEVNRMWECIWKLLRRFLCAGNISAGCKNELWIVNWKRGEKQWPWSIRRTFFHIFLKRLTKSRKYVRQDSRCSGRQSNQGPPEWETRG